MALPLDNSSDQTALNRFFEPEEALPSFTQALRGYHKDEVDEYLRELRDSRDEDAQALADAENEVQELRARVASLERTLQDETPHTIEALGERLVLILRHAEEGASDALAEANAEADRLGKEARERADAFVRQASLRSTQAAQELKNARREAEELSQRAEAEANERAAAMINAAEVQASAHLSDAERRAAELREQARLEQIRADEAIQAMRARGEAELQRLAARRQHVVDSLGDIHSTIDDALRAKWSDPAEELEAVSFQIDHVEDDRDDRNRWVLDEPRATGELVSWHDDLHSVETYTAGAYSTEADRAEAYGAESRATSEQEAIDVPEGGTEDETDRDGGGGEGEAD